MGKREKQNKIAPVVMAIRGALAVLLLGAAFCAGIRYAPALKRLLSDPGAAETFRDFVQSLGSLGVAALLALQIFQVVFAVVPSDPIEMAAGMCCGWLWGSVLCSLGVLLGTILTFFLARRYGEGFISLFVKEKQRKKMRFLEDADKLELMTFLLYFFPGLPKDVFTYLAALTPIKPVRFFVISSIGRIPSIVVTVTGGANLLRGNVADTVLLFAVFGGIGLIGLAGYRLLTGRMERKR